ncbi:MAG: NAD-dependent epimerase/dehydratase family protein [Chloroflexi bacterium]|nr:NAD-dependent epimerase/dehydratase family protein [Chloroflexota bacterium]
MSTVLVTGGCGFIGGHLVNHLSKLGHNVLVFDRQPPPPWLSDLPRIRFERGDLLKLLAKDELLEGVDAIYHLAWAHIPESATQHPVNDIQTNLITTVRLLQAASERGVRRILFPSTGGAIYGLVTRLPVSEDHPKEPISAYGVTKLAAEKYIELYHRLHGLEYAILRPSAPYGPWQDPLGRQGAVAVFMGRILTGRPITIWGDGDAIIRDFFHISDLVRAFLLAAHHPAETAIYNIGGGQPISLNQLLAEIMRIAGPQHKVIIHHRPPRPFDVPRLVLDITRARETLGWTPQTRLSEGLASTWAWCRDVWLPRVRERG